MRKSQAQPRWATRRRPERDTYGAEVAEVAKLLGTPLLPWQRQVVDVALEVDPSTGLLAYREVWFSVMRQSGKTTLALPMEVHRCISPTWGGPQRVVYTAQTGWEAKTKFLEDQVPILQASPLGKLVTKPGGGRIRRAQGDWGANFGGTGGAIDVLGSSPSAGHGRTLDLGVIDEAWKDEDDRREQALLPAMVTRPMAQLLGFSTMGTDASTYLNRKVETGRSAAGEDSGAGMAYFEWSIPEDEDIDDPKVWWRYMPALGHTISEAAVAHARQTMSEGEFRRAFGNQKTSSSERVIHSAVWDAVQDPNAEPSGELSWGVDLLRGVEGHPDSGSIGVFGDGKVAVIEHRPGTTWIVDRMRQLHEARGGRIVVDGGGPAASVADEMEDAGLPVVRLTGGAVASACGRIYDAIADCKVRVYPSQPLDDAIGGLHKKPVGDRFVWARTASSSDVTPLMAATLAFSRGQQEVTPFVAFD